jgi:hypothetical protein
MGRVEKAREEHRGSFSFEDIIDMSFKKRTISSFIQQLPHYNVRGN